MAIAALCCAMVVALFEGGVKVGGEVFLIVVKYM